MRTDLWAHAGAGWMLADAALCVGWPWWVGAGLVLLAGVGKEVLDSRTGGTVDWKDTAATLTGGALSLAANLGAR